MGSSSVLATETGRPDLWVGGGDGGGVGLSYHGSVSQSLTVELWLALGLQQSSCLCDLSTRLVDSSTVSAPVAIIQAQSLTFRLTLSAWI